MEGERAALLMVAVNEIRAAVESANGKLGDHGRGHHFLRSAGKGASHQFLAMRPTSLATVPGLRWSSGPTGMEGWACLLYTSFVRHAADWLEQTLAAETHPLGPRKRALMQLLHPAQMGQKFQVLHARRGRGGFGL